MSWGDVLSNAKINRVGPAVSALAVEWRHTLDDWRRRDRERMELRRMSDRELRDIGVTRADIWEEANKPFWRGTTGSVKGNVAGKAESGLTARPAILAAAAIIIILAGTVGLWAYYAATVFFETVRAGFVACFG